MPPHAARIALASAVALVAFASNSIFCRLALGTRQIDPTTFTTIRVVSGAGVLAALAWFSRARRSREYTRAGWTSGGYLFAYAIAFSFSYTSLGASTGALILFPAVQMTMLIAALRAGERPRPFEWLGLSVALAGLVYLVMPGLQAPSPAGAALMVAAGVAWGLYSLRGRGSPDPLGDTARNFICAVPLALVASVIALPRSHRSSEGVALAVVSGAVSSGLGYVIWYAALRGLTATRAATVQLAVPVIAAVGGIVFLAEMLTTRLVVAGILILGGVGTALAARRR